MITFLAKKYIKKDIIDDWSLHVRDEILKINIKSIRIYGYSPAQLRLKYKL